MKEWLVKQEKVKRLEERDRAELKKDFPFRGYSEILITVRLEHLQVQLYERAIQVGIGLPLFDLNAQTLAYEKHLEMNKNKLSSRLAICQVTLK